MSPVQRAMEPFRAHIGSLVVLAVGLALVAIGNTWERAGGLVLVGAGLWFGWRLLRRATLAQE